jgi:hypothetical protein
LALSVRFREQVTHLKLVTSMSNATLPVFAATQYQESGGHDRHLQVIPKVYRLGYGLTSRGLLDCVRGSVIIPTEIDLLE